MSAHELWYESESYARTALGAALKHLEELARYDAHFRSRHNIGGGEGDRGDDVMPRCGTLPTLFMPRRGGWRRLRRLAALGRLKRKYGQTLNEVDCLCAEAARSWRGGEQRDALLGVKGKEEQDAAGVSRRCSEALPRAGEAAKVSKNWLRRIK